MGTGTEIGRVRGLGSAKSGAHHWWMQRLTAGSNLLLMLWFLYKVTGIPATEEQSLRTKGEAYRRYQRTTSPFIPWFPKEDR